MNDRLREATGIRLLDALVTSALVVAIAIASWALTSTIELRERVAVIESNRFSEQDASLLEQRLRAEMLQGVNDIKKCLNQIQRNQTCDF